MNDQPTQFNNDHDVLIQVNTKLEQVISDIKELKNNFASRVSTLESEKANQSQVDDHEKRIRSNERFIYYGLGALAIIQLVFYYLVHKQ